MTRICLWTQSSEHKASSPLQIVFQRKRPHEHCGRECIKLPCQRWHSALQNYILSHGTKLWKFCCGRCRAPSEQFRLLVDATPTCCQNNISPCYASFGVTEFHLQLFDKPATHLCLTSNLQSPHGIVRASFLIPSF